MDWENELLSMIRLKDSRGEYVLNEERWADVKFEITRIANFFLESEPEAKVEFQILPHFAEHCGLIVEVYDFATNDVVRFCELICSADNIYIDALPNGKVRLCFGYNDIAKRV